MGHVLVELWRPVTFKSTTYLIVSIHRMARLIDLSKNNYQARLPNNRFKSYAPPKFYKDMSYIQTIEAKNFGFLGLSFGTQP